MAFGPQKTAEFQTPVILGIETSGTFGSVALVCGGLCVAEITMGSRLSHSRRLLTGITRILEETGMTLDAIDVFAISLGPGSFTGLRIGLATVKGLAMACKRPICGVASLDGLASQIPYTPLLVCPVLDARKHEVYTALYRADMENGGLKRLHDFRALKPDVLAREIHEPVVFLGDGLNTYGPVFKGILGNLASFLPAAIFFPRASAIAKLAGEQFLRGETLDLDTAAPIYVRASEAELNWQSAHQGPCGPQSLVRTT